jgi:hypothetical protein
MEPEWALQPWRIPYAAAMETLALGNPNLAPFLTPASRRPILATFPAPASLTRQRNEIASVQVAYSGSLPNASVPDTPAQ